MPPANSEANRTLLVDQSNYRIKLLEYQSNELVKLNQEMEAEAAEIHATKLIIYARQSDVTQLQALGYHCEGVIDGFHNGRNAHMMSKYLSQDRAESHTQELAEEIIRISLSKSIQQTLPDLPSEYTLREATVADAEELAKLYKQVFPVYPTPMDQADYVKKTMEESTYYYVVELHGQIVCAASAEVTPEYGSAEITDCATHPDHAGNRLLQYIFPALEQKMSQMGVHYLYTLTRAQSHGMNITAAKLGYQYRGRLINNCTIYSGFEDMNIWVKSMQETHDN